MLTDRYRIVGLVGKGGMGEVYRADDLKLRQPVALKFLPEALTHNQQKLDRFHHEVRVARQVSHPNVCRVYDIGDANGQPFITMEYVDGEDLASVLRRMGRPSQDKALQIARQLCAGLAAAHDKGVLHRDLKPHNIMIDGQGRVRVTDFGLAGFIEEFSGAEVRGGTPAYMAPEQVIGRGVSVKTDLYSLGLVLFELFTGRRAFEGSTREEIDRSRTTPPTSISSLVQDIDPAVERVILRCLETEPAARPSSALAIAAALPGGDPLAAALAAGETPDPAMVAAAGDIGGMRPAAAVACLIGAIVGILAVAALADTTRLFRKVTLAKPPQALADRAAELITELGYTGNVADSAYGFRSDGDYLRYIEEHDKTPERWDRLATNRPPAINFWYRQSPRRMIPPPIFNGATWNQPPRVLSGMAGTVLDPEGRLINFYAVPPQREDSAVESADSPTATDWSKLFDAAKLDMASFTPAPPLWTPAHYADERKAWVGHYSDQPDVELRVEASAYRGKPTYMLVIGPWIRPWRMEKAPERAGFKAGQYFFFTVFMGVFVGSILLARRNLRLRRGDRVGALRFCSFLCGVVLINWALAADHIPVPWEEFGKFFFATGRGLFIAAWMWMIYIAVEPYVRRHWPQVLISWTRLLAGRIRDPLVGRDILVGTVVGVFFALSSGLRQLAVAACGAPPPQPGLINLDSLLGGRHLIATLFQFGTIWFTLFTLFILFALRTVLRRQWLAVLGFVLIFTTLDLLRDWSRLEGLAMGVSICFAVVTTLLHVMLLLRFGLLALAVGLFIAGMPRQFPICLDFSTWYATGSFVGILTVLVVAGFGFHTALAGRPLLRDELAAE